MLQIADNSQTTRRENIRLASFAPFAHLPFVRLAFAVLALTLALPSQAALPRLAYFGNLRGEVNVPALPPLSWSFTAAAPAGGQQSARFSLIGEGVTLHAVVEADNNTDRVSWRIEEGHAQLGPWFHALLARYAPDIGAASAIGDVTITGQGTLDGFQPSGRLSIQCRDAIVRDDTQGWLLEGLTFAGDFMLGPDFTLYSDSPFTLGIRTITTSRFGARAFSLQGQLENLSSLAVDAARVEIAGGEVESAPFTLPLSPPSIEARVRIKRVGLQDFAQLIPSGLADARGRLDGELILGWSEAAGFQLGIGNLSLDEFEPTVIRLAPSPGFLTSRLPARFAFLPGKIGEWLSVRNQAYYDLSDIELGRTELAVNALRVSLTPDGDAEGRSARVFIDASPIPPDGAVKQVLFTVNVAGPLSRLLHLGMTQEFSADFR